MRQIRVSKYKTLFFAASIWFIAKAVRYSFPPLFETLQSSYSISNAFVGSIYTILLVVYSLLQTPSGILADRYGSVKIVVAGSITAAIGSLFLVFDTPVYILVLSMILIGAGTGAHKIVAVQILSKIYSKRTGRTLGIFDTFGSYGGVGASFIVTAFLISPPVLDIFINILPGESWRAVFLVFGTIGILLAIGFGLYVPKQLSMNTRSSVEKEPTNTSPGVAEYFKQLSNLRVSIFLAAAILFSITYNGVVAFLPLFLTETMGYSSSVGNLLYSVLFGVSIVQILTGDVSDRVGRLPIIIAMLLLSGFSLMLLVAFTNISVVLAGSLIVMFAVGSHGFRPVRAVYFVEILPERIASGGFGIVRTLLMMAGAVAPPLVGYIADVSSFRIAFTLLVIIMLVASLFSVGVFLLERSSNWSVG